MNSTLLSVLITVFSVGVSLALLCLLSLLGWVTAQCGQWARSKLHAGTPKLTLHWRKGRVSEYSTPGAIRALPFSRNGQSGYSPSPEGLTTRYLRSYGHGSSTVAGPSLAALRYVPRHGNRTARTRPVRLESRISRMLRAGSRRG